jgi:hypothetical protein
MKLRVKGGEGEGGGGEAGGGGGSTETSRLGDPFTARLLDASVARPLVFPRSAIKPDTKASAAPAVTRGGGGGRQASAVGAPAPTAEGSKPAAAVADVASGRGGADEAAGRKGDRGGARGPEKVADRDTSGVTSTINTQAAPLASVSV